MDKVSSFSFFSNDVELKESPLRVLSPDMFVLLFYSYFSTFLFN